MSASWLYDGASSLTRRQHSIKYFQHPLTNQFRLEKLKPYFQDVYNSKPKASRGDSSEGYWVCMGFKGAQP